MEPKSHAEQIDLEDAISLSFTAPLGEADPTFERSVQSVYLDSYGREKPNPVPLEPPVGYVKRPTIAETMRQMIRQASEEAKMAGAETLEESEDFDIGEEFDPTSPWEDDFEIDPALDAMLALASKPPKKEPPQAQPVEAPSSSTAVASTPSGTQK